MALGVQAIRMTAEHLTVAFSLDLTNNGPVAATGLMIRIALGQGSAMQEAVIARFFDGEGGSVLRDDIELAPRAGERFKPKVKQTHNALRSAERRVGNVCDWRCRYSGRRVN